MQLEPRTLTYLLVLDHASYRARRTELSPKISVFHRLRPPQTLNSSTGPDNRTQYLKIEPMSIKENFSLVQAFRQIVSKMR